MEGNFSCSQCDAGPFRKLKYLRYHEETVHSTDRSYTCPTCGSSYKRSSHLRRHMQNTHSSCEIKCDWPECGKVFKGREQYRKHIRRHETKSSHACGLCGKSFSKKRQLEAHCEKIHGPFPCVKCGEIFSSRKEFVLHLKTLHKEEVVSKLVYCKYCDAAEFDSPDKLRLHVKECHENFPCPFCNVCFSRGRDLKSHIILKHVSDSDELAVSYTNKRTCTLCGVVFASVSNLRCHMRTLHENEKKFACAFCDKKFSHKHVLNRHVDNIHGSTPRQPRETCPIPTNPQPVPIHTPLRVLTVCAGP